VEQPLIIPVVVDQALITAQLLEQVELAVAEMGQILQLVQRVRLEQVEAVVAVLMLQTVQAATVVQA
jgi:hypothetical protein